MVDPASIRLPPFCLGQDDVVPVEKDLVLAGVLLFAGQVDNERTETDDQLWIEIELRERETRG